MKRALPFALAAGAVAAVFPMSSHDAAAIEQIPGIALPSDIIDLAPAVDGIVSVVHVDVGDTVEAGQLIAELDASVERAAEALAEHEASSDVARRMAKVEWVEAQRRYDRRKNLTSQFSADEIADFEAEAKVKELAFLDAEEDARQAELEWKRAQATLARMELHSPIDGVVTQRDLSPGELASRSGQSMVLQVSCVDPLLVEVRTPALMIDEVKVGTEVEVWFEQPGRPHRKATVTAIQPVIETASQTFLVRMSIPNEDGSLRAGVRCGVRFQN